MTVKPSLQVNPEIQELNLPLVDIWKKLWKNNGDWSGFMIAKKYQSWSFRRLMTACIEKEYSPV